MDHLLLGWSVMAPSLKTGYHILPNKCSCLYKRAPDFWLQLAISQKPLNPSHSEFHPNQTGLRVRFVPLCPVRLFSEIRYFIDLQMLNMYISLSFSPLTCFEGIWHLVPVYVHLMVAWKQHYYHIFFTKLSLLPNWNTRCVLLCNWSISEWMIFIDQWDESLYPNY